MSTQKNVESEKLSTKTPTEKKRSKPPMYRVDTTKDHPSIITTNPEYNVFWSQNEKLVFIDLLVSFPDDKIDVTYDTNTFSLKYPGTGYELQLKLANAVHTNFFTYKLHPNKVEMKLKKDLYKTAKNNQTWKSLCKDGLDLEKGRVDDQMETTSKQPNTNDNSATVPQSLNNTASKVSHDWYQTETEVIIEVRVKGLLEKEVNVEFGKRSISIHAKLPYSNNREYQLMLDLAHEVIPDRSSHKTLPTKLEIKLAKKETIRWTSLEEQEEGKELEECPTEDGKESDSSKKPARKDIYKYWDSAETQNFMNYEIWQAYRQSIDKENDTRSKDKFVQDTVQDYIAMEMECERMSRERGVQVTPRDVWGGNIPPRYI